MRKHSYFHSARSMNIEGSLPDRLVYTAERQRNKRFQSVICCLVLRARRADKQKMYLCVCIDGKRSTHDNIYAEHYMHTNKWKIR